jgi:hypothetical protein
MKKPKRAARCELFILSDGTILGHNLTPAMASILSEINPVDAGMKQRSGKPPRRPRKSS